MSQKCLTKNVSQKMSHSKCLKNVSLKMVFKMSESVLASLEPHSVYLLLKSTF